MLWKIGMTLWWSVPGLPGCVLANRLSENPKVRVLLCEAGPPDRAREIHIPAALTTLFRSDADWAYFTEPQDQLDDRRVFWPRGKTLGGSSSINAMVWARGMRADYDEWGALAGPDWAYDAVLPYFRRAEDTRGRRSAHTGRGGPITVSGATQPAFAHRGLPCRGGAGRPIAQCCT